MLTFRQMERFHTVVDSINQLEAMIAKIDNGIGAQRYDTISRAHGADPHTLENQIILKDKAERMLKLLSGHRDDNLHLIRKTIEEATNRSKPSVRLKQQLLMKMRYEQGRDWAEIETILKINHPEIIVMNMLEGSSWK